MIENYVHWNEDIGEWQLVSTAFVPTGRWGASQARGHAAWPREVVQGCAR